MEILIEFPKTIAAFADYKGDLHFWMAKNLPSKSANPLYNHENNDRFKESLTPLRERRDVS